MTSDVSSVPAGLIPASRRLRTYEIPCAPGHDVVYGLAPGAGNEIYLAASNEFQPGLCAVVYAFDTVTGRFRLVIDVQAATGFEPASGRMPHSKIHLCLQACTNGRVFAATHFTAPGIGQTDFEAIAAYRGKYHGCFLLEYDPQGDAVRNHGLLLKGEGARIACLDEKNGRYYFLSYPRGHLYRYDYDDRVLHDLGRTGQENAFGLEVDDAGRVYTSDDWGRILRYTPGSGGLEELDLYVPLSAGRRAAANYIRRMTKGADGCFYGFGNKGMHLFRLDPRREEVEDFGVIYGADGDTRSRYPRLPPAKAVVQTDPQTLLIAFGGDGIYGDPHPVPNLVQFDLRKRRSREGGKFVCPDDGLPAWIPQCALHVPQANAVYFGLQQTVGMLRLWKVDLAQPDGPRHVEPGPLYRDHLRVIHGKPFGASVEGTNRLPFVRRGHVQMQELGWRGEDRVIPAEETAIADLCFADGNTLYGVTIGRGSHLFAYRPHRQNRFTENYEVHPWDLGVVHATATRRARLFLDVSRQRLLIAAQTAQDILISAYQVGAEAGRYCGTYHSVPHWPPVQWDAPPFSPLARLEGDAAVWENLAYLPEHDTFWSTTPGGRLIRLAKADALVPHDLGATLSRPGLVAVDAQRLLGITPEGEGLLIRVDRSGALIVEASFPAVGVEANCLAVDPARNRVAVGGVDGRLVLLDLHRPAERISLRLPNAWRVRSLVWHPGGLVYGFYGEEDAIGEAFCADPATGTLHEIGILQVSSQPRYWMCHRCDALAVGPRGEVYFGEHDRIAHLFTYIDPPVAP